MKEQSRSCWIAASTKLDILALALGTMLLLAAPGSTLAAQVFQQPPVDGNDAFPSFVDDQSADNFSLSSDALVNQVRWWGSYLIEPDVLQVDDDFRIGFFNDDGGVPETDPFVEFAQPGLNLTRTSTLLQDGAGGTVFQFDATLPSAVALMGGTTYFFSIVNFFDALDAEWFWLLSNGAGSNAFRFGDGSSWETDLSGDLAFALFTESTPVTEPSTFYILVGGLLLVLGARRRFGRDVRNG